MRYLLKKTDFIKYTDGPQLAMVPICDFSTFNGVKVIGIFSQEGNQIFSCEAGQQLVQLLVSLALTRASYQTLQGTVLLS